MTAPLSNLTLAVWTILVAALGNVACATLGCFLVLRRMSLLGDAISHAVLPGLAVAFLLTGQLTGVPIVAGAVVMGLLTTFLTQGLHSAGKVPEDASMGVVFTSLFAVGVLIISSSARQAHIDADCMLYGLLEFVPLDTVPFWGWQFPRALLAMSVAAVVVWLFVAVLWKELKIVAFDPETATAMGIHAGVVHYLLMAMVAAVTVTAFEAVGSILVIAMLIVPAATAHLLTDRLGTMVLLANIVGVLSAILGYLLAAWWNTSVAGMMAVMCGLQFSLAVFLAPRHGLLSKWLQNLLLSLQIAGEDVLATLYRQEESAGTTVSRAAAAIPQSWLVLAWLRRRGMLAKGAAGFRLTESGRQSARSLVRAHRLWEKFLATHFDLPLDHVHDAAAWMEHFLTPELQGQLASGLADPDVDPHGRAIPAAESRL